MAREQLLMELGGCGATLGGTPRCLYVHIFDTKQLADTVLSAHHWDRRFPYYTLEKRLA